MSNLTLGGLSTFTAWAAILVNHRRVSFADADMTLSVYGEGDDSYLVIETYKSDVESTQYMLTAEGNEIPLAALFDFLKLVDFKFIKLLELLTSLPYQMSETGEVIKIGQVKIFRTPVKATTEDKK
ncbi:MAG: hypothetical protein HY308_04265 [Gammaproteobacteria bacterium]|nr:hypothetical protein [Gammaproteobacteria bacterium]